MSAVTTKALRVFQILLVALWLALVLVLASCGPVDELGAEDDIAMQCYAATRVCPDAASSVEGIDVSKWQGDIDWVQVASSGIVFGIARASHGTNTDDAYFTANWQGMKQNGIIRGVYQYFSPSQDPIAQADFMLSKIAQAGGLEAGDLPPVLDLEEAGSVSPATLQQKALQWLQHVEQQTGRKPMIYTAAYFAQDNLGTALADYPVWIANYTSSSPAQGGCPLMPDDSGWLDWTMWQYTAEGSVPGIAGNVDRNIFDGDRAALQAFIASTGPDEPPRGALETVTCDRVAGWAFDQPNLPIDVELYVDVPPAEDGAATAAAAVPAQDQRDDLCATLGSCNHGFEWQITATYRDNRPHQLYAFARDPDSGALAPLEGSPRPFTCDASPLGPTNPPPGSTFTPGTETPRTSPSGCALGAAPSANLGCGWTGIALLLLAWVRVRRRATRR